MNSEEKKKLLSLYEKASKHSNYQVLPKRLELLLKGEVEPNTRSEVARLRYMLKNVPVKNKKIIDIGGNTGFFTFELLEKGADSVAYYEGNKEHAHFVSLAANLLGFAGKVLVNNEYFSFKHSRKKYDIGLLLNVLHHVGDDYGDREVSMEEAKEIILEQLNWMTEIVDTLIFQLGFNWQGDISRPLFEKGTKREMIDFIAKGTKGNWQIDSVGVAEKMNGEIVYNDLNDVNVQRDDSLGEFLNRPLFILKSKKVKW